MYINVILKNFNHQLNRLIMNIKKELKTLLNNMKNITSID